MVVNNTMDPLATDPDRLKNIWDEIVEIIVNHKETVNLLPVSPTLDPDEIKKSIRKFNFSQPIDALTVIQLVVDAMYKHQVHPPHRSYFGLYNPAPTAISIIAEALVSTFNPNLANWSNSPFGCEVENHLITVIGDKFGYAEAECDGVFTSGGAEANHTALLVALIRKYGAMFHQHGVRKLPKQPVFYISSEGHHSFLKAARLCGLGTNAVRNIPVNDNLQIDTSLLTKQIRQDRIEGLSPFMLVATVGTTSAGAIDSLDELADISVNENLWFHVDAAWGGAIALVPKLREVLRGIEKSDSIAFDPHKWLSVPMGAGIFLTKHKAILSQTFSVTTDYMPSEATNFKVNDPFKRSMQWSRPFIGLKLFMSLLVAGWSGYESSILQMVNLGQYLREQLSLADWQIINKTALPVVCFNDKSIPVEFMSDFLDHLLDKLLKSGNAWLSKAVLKGQHVTLRACITNHQTSKAEIDQLVETLRQIRSTILVERDYHVQTLISL